VIDIDTLRNNMKNRKLLLIKNKRDFGESDSEIYLPSFAKKNHAADFRIFSWSHRKRLL